MLFFHFFSSYPGKCIWRLWFKSRLRPPWPLPLHTQRVTFPLSIPGLAVVLWRKRCYWLGEKHQSLPAHTHARTHFPLWEKKKYGGHTSLSWLRTLEYSTVRKRKPGALLGGAWPSRLSGVIILFQLPEAILGYNPVKQSGSSCLLFIYLIFLSLQASVSCLLFSTAVRYHLIIPSTPNPQQSHI